MDLYILDVEGTQEDIVINGVTGIEIRVALDKLESIITNTELGIETSISQIGNSYITTKDNAAWYREEYGWIFSKVTIMELS